MVVSARPGWNFAYTTLYVDSADAVRASWPANQEAVRFYSEGRAKLWMFDFVGTRLLLAKAVKADPAEVNRAKSLADSSHNLLYRLQFMLESARTLIASDHPESSRSQLNKR